jgi:hypothetical protein
MIKALKYIVNIAGSLVVLWFSYVSFAIIATVPEPNNIKLVIWNCFQEMVAIFLIMLIITTAINILLEWKLEDKMKSQENLFMLIFHFLIFGFGFAYFANDFYIYCQNHQSQTETLSASQ